MSEYDLQFQADLEKAQALSLESLALEQFRRQRKFSTPGVSTESSVLRDVTPPALPPPPRRPSRPRATLPDISRSTGTSPNRDEGSDLISFSSPTSKTAPQDPAQAALKEYIDQITKLGQQTEDLSITKTPEQSTMNYNYNNQPGYYSPYGYYPPYPQAAYPPGTPGTNTGYPPGTPGTNTGYPPGTPGTNTGYPPGTPGSNSGYPMGTPGTNPGYPMGTPGTNSGYPMGAMPMPYGYYPASISGQDGAQYSPATPPVFPPYNHTRMAAPAPTYVHPYPTTPPTPPHYNFNTTNLISRPTRPMMYPQLGQMHNYASPMGNSVQISGKPGNLGQTQGKLGQATGNVGQATGNVGQATGNLGQTTGIVGQTAGNPGLYPSLSSGSVVNNGSSKRNSVEGDGSRKSSDVGVEKSESNDSVGSLPDIPLNLIDFGRHSGSGSVRVSVLEAFDPLLTEQCITDYAAPSECSSVYEEYDPLEFLYGETEMRDAPVYATVSKRDNNTQPAPPPKTIPTVPAVPNRATTNKLYDSIVKLNTRNYTSEHKAFVQMVLDVRKKFPYTDEATNPGYMVAQRTAGKYAPNTSIKIVVYPPHSEEPITFTSDVESTVDHVILTVVCSLEEEIEEDVSSGYMLRVYGAEEYLPPGSTLSSFAYVRECVRLERDVRLVLRPRTTLPGDGTVRRHVTRHDARGARDDARAAHLTANDLVPNDGTSQLSFDNLSILFETLEGELSRAIGVASAEGCCPAGSVLQATKAICALAGNVETLHVTHTLQAFARACANHNASTAVTPEIVSESGPYSVVSVRRATVRESVTSQCARLRDAVRALVALYCRSHLVDVALAGPAYSTPTDVNKAVGAHTISETTLICIEAVHAAPPGWKHDEFVWHAQVYHGTRPMMQLHTTQYCKVDCGGFYPRIIFDTWINLEDMPVNTLPRESRLVLTLHGRTQRPQDNTTNPDTNPQHVEEADETMYQQVQLGWTALQLYDYDGMLASGNYMLPVWPTCADKRIGPAPDLMHSPPGPHPVVNIEIPLYAHNGVRWSSGETTTKPTHKEQASFDSLDGHTQSQLLHLIEQGSYQKMPTECREVLWEKRNYLVQLPGALPLVLLTASNWYGEQREQLISLLKQWERPSSHNAIHLLLPCFPDSAVREYASELLGEMSDDDLCSVLPQLVQAVRHEASIVSPLAELLLSRALSSPRIAHSLYCLLAHYCTEGANQETLGITLEDGAASNPEPSAECCVTWSWRIRLLTRALVLTCGENIAHALARQQLLVKALSDVAHSVKTAKDGNRQRALTSSVQELANLVRSEPTALPLGLAKRVHDVDIKSCTYFSSNTLPLKINFIGMDNAVIPAMFKVGDDLRQDALVLQIMRVMDNLWLKAGLDLRMVTFQALPTSYRKGMIEIVTEAETLRAIQTEWGLTGSFKDKPIAEWLAKHNPSELEYQRARDNFTASCAGYSVATYLLGICDRHNDNIMLKTSGHLFHIDFGKFLGDAQMFGNFKRDRAPFVLTHDMVYVINGGLRPTQRFHHFVELCCMAFNIVRQHSSHILDLIALMATVGVSGVTPAAVGYVRAALLPTASAPEAAAAFARLIHSSLKSKFTPINFFLHNLAQMRASGDQGSSTSELLSFIPRTYTMAQEGRLVSVECLGYEKRYDPEKHYVYALRIYRQGQATPSVLYRSYKHFTELYQKICVHFPLSNVHSLPSGLHVGRSNIRQVAERRFGDVQAFLTSLFSLADEIAHSDLVYTFFHPLLRDQQDIEPQRVKNRGETAETESSGSGALKLSIQYAGGVLSVLILHAQSLAVTPQGLPPNPYVKVYLVPDPTKETKRKTRVLKRNSHPSFMEMLEYRLPIEVIKNRSLQATVWHYDSLQENQFLGGVVIPLNALSLREETLAWYPLQYIPR